MKRLAVGLLCWMMVSGLTACQEDIDEKPQILSMSVEGISPQNITIDQHQRRITVLLPPTLPSLFLSTSFALSRQAELNPFWTEGKKGIDLSGYCPSSIYTNGQLQDPSIEMSAIVSNKKQKSTYTIQLKSTGPLQITPLTTPVVYDSKATNYDLVVPVENYYGSSSIGFISVTPRGSASPVWTGPGGGYPMEKCAHLLNKVNVSLYVYRKEDGEGKPVGSSLKPGLYDLGLRLTDGTQVLAEGYILVK